MRHTKRTTTVLGMIVLAAALTTVSACRSTEPVGEQLSDSAITAKIKAKLAGDPEVNPFNVSVTTDEGVVTLTGRVAKEEARIEAVKLARGTKGVKRVIDMIKVGDQQHVGN